MKPKTKKALGWLMVAPLLVLTISLGLISFRGLALAVWEEPAKYAIGLSVCIGIGATLYVLVRLAIKGLDLALPDEEIKK